MRVLVVDDNSLYRKIISEAIAAIDGAEVVATAPHGSLALQKLRHTGVDLVLLDMVMPEMDGIETLRHIREEFPHVAVVMVSGTEAGDAPNVLRALDMGAVEFISKPQGAGVRESAEGLVRELRRVLAMARNWLVMYRPGGTASPSRSAAPVVKPPKPAPTVSLRTGLPARRPGRLGLVLIGVSTGGPKALSQVIPLLPADLPCPVLLVQHMPPNFTKSLAEHLDRESPLRVHEAVHGEPVLNGHVYIAPGGRHMVVAPRPEGGLAVALNDDPPVQSCRPSVDVMFRSVASVVGFPVLAVVLTGMGADGADGVEALKQRGLCHCISQSEGTCVVYGMPQAVESRGLADEVLPLDGIAARIAAITKNPVLI